MNRLANTTSPYLLQHQANPVDWWPWGEDAFTEARATGKPILLSVGYAACHWCHVMAHESFENGDVAGVMNALFVNIKVDREERPDVDHIYMSALHALGEQGGWPLTMFLTAAGEPFWGGTYFPREARFGRPAFVTVLREVARVFHEEPDRVAHNRQLLAKALSRAANGEAQAGLGRSDLDRVGTYLSRSFDASHGGLAGAPKFPNPTMLECLWRHADRTGEAEARARFLTTLERMAQGGIHDHVGGGFARYAVDERWLVPHFEKMLYDNAQLLELMALAAADTGQSLLREAAHGIVAWLQREMTTADGAFASSLDADSEGEEGRFYVWTQAEIAGVLGDDAALFACYYDVSADGNWEGRVILNRLTAPEPDTVTAGRLAAMRARLLEARAKRPRPGLDDKILADWNALTIAALVRAALALGQPAWIAIARQAYRAIADTMTRDGGRLAHSARAGKLLFPGFAADYAAMARAAIILHEATAEEPYLGHARHWLNILHSDYRDAETGLLHMTPSGGPNLIMRPRPTHDDAVPNANGLYAEALVRLAMISGATADGQIADAIVDRLSAAARAAPIAHASILNALDLRLRGAAIVVVGGAGGAGLGAMRQAALAIPYPVRSVTGMENLAAGHPARAAAGAAAEAALVCAGERCSLPVTEPARLAAEVAAMTGRAA